MFTNKDLDFVNKAEPSVRAELYVWEFERYDLVVPLGKPLVNIYSYIKHEMYRSMVEEEGKARLNWMANTPYKSVMLTGELGYGQQAQHVASSLC
jgi:hypothetical protein